jgi:hypothetical protein
MTKRKEIRLAGRYLFIFYHKSIGIGEKSNIVRACTNKRILAKKTSIDYNVLMWHFTRKNKCFYENGDTIIMKLYTSDIEKGLQSMVRKGKGGMDKFMERYVIKKREDY